MRGVPVSRYVVHERYDRRHVENDIALVRLRYSIELGSGTTAVCLPAPVGSGGGGGGDRDSLTGRHAVVTGWGTTSFSKRTPGRPARLSIYRTRTLPCFTQSVNQSHNLFSEGDTSPILQEASLKILSLSDSVCQTGIATGNAVESKLCAYSESGDACQVGNKVLDGVQGSTSREMGNFMVSACVIRRPCSCRIHATWDHGFARNPNLDKSRVTAVGPSSPRTATLALSWVSYPTESNATDAARLEFTRE